MPDSEVVRVMRSFKAGLLREESAQMRAMARRWLQVERALDGNMAAVAEQMSRIAADGGTVSNGLLWQEARYRLLITQLQQELGKYTEYVDRSIVDRQGQLARLGAEHAAQSIEAQGVNAGFARLPVESIEAMVGLTGDGTPVRSLLVTSWPDAAEGLTQALVRGVALGWNPRKTARAMARESTRSLNRMMVIARTEQLRVYREATLASYRNSGVVSGHRRLATHDDRVCPACLMDEGTFYELSQSLPEHPQGRCTSVPVVIGVPAIKWQSGRDWFYEQPEATQRSILGNGRYDAWQLGRFGLEELVKVIPNSTWGDSLQTTPLRELV